jgi:hypothetical protein
MEVRLKFFNLPGIELHFLVLLANNQIAVPTPLSRGSVDGKGKGKFSKLFLLEDLVKTYWKGKLRLAEKRILTLVRALSLRTGTRERLYL